MKLPRLIGTLALSCSSITAQNASHLGFDRNAYPGDANLKALHETFSYTGYWLNNPPGERTTAPSSNPPASASSCSSTDASTQN